MDDNFRIGGLSRGEAESRGEVDNKLKLNLTSRTLPRTDMFTDPREGMD